MFWTQDWEMGNSFNYFLPYQIIPVLKVTQSLDCCNQWHNLHNGIKYRSELFCICNSEIKTIPLQTTHQEESENTWSQILFLILRNYNIDDIIWGYDSFFLILYHHLRSKHQVVSC